MKFKKCRFGQDLKMVLSLSVTPHVLNAGKESTGCGEEDTVSGPGGSRVGAIFLELVVLGVFVDGFNSVSHYC